MKVLLPGEIRIKQRDFEYGADLFTLHFVGMLAKPGKCPCIWARYIQQYAERGGFTTAVGPKEAKYGTAFDFQVKIAYSRDGTVSFGQTLDGKDNIFQLKYIVMSKDKTNKERNHYRGDEIFFR
jgi:hypothetical protein